MEAILWLYAQPYDPDYPVICFDEQLEWQVLALVAERHEQRLPINWQFSIPAARSKLSRHYDKIRHDSAETKPSKT